ncbi:hypothetical protein ACTFIR_006372 [Dictyostelium discoideum]
MNNEYSESFWKVFKNKYLLNYILKNKCCYKSKKYKNIASIDSMLKHKQYQLKDRNDEIINEIKDIEVFKEIYSLLLFKGYRDDSYHPILFDRIWGTKSADLFDFHLKYHPEKLQTHINTGSIDSIILYNHPKLLIKVLNFFKESINHNKPFTLTKNERNHFIMKYLGCKRYGCDIEEIKEWMKIISNIPISSTSIFEDSEKRVPSIDTTGYHENEEFNKYEIPTQQTCQIINLTKIKVNFNHFPNVTSYLFQRFIQLLNFEGVQLILDNLIGNNLELNEKAFKDEFHDRIYTCKYLYKDLIEMIQFLIDKFSDGQLSLSNLSLILNYLFLKLIRVNNLTIDQIKAAHQLISNYIEIKSSEYTSYYYLKTLSPIIESCITIIKDPTGVFEEPLYDRYISIYIRTHIYK